MYLRIICIDFLFMLILRTMAEIRRADSKARWVLVIVGGSG